MSNCESEGEHGQTPNRDVGTEILGVLFSYCLASIL